MDFFLYQRESDFIPKWRTCAMQFIEGKKIPVKNLQVMVHFLKNAFNDEKDIFISAI